MEATRLRTLGTIGCVLAAILGGGCSTGSTEVPIVEKHAAGNRQMTVARIAVDGMMCEVACGSKIRKELLELEGVANADIDFTADRALNYAEVEYDPQRLQPQDLAGQIAAIAGGIYQVKEVQITHFAQAGGL
jgi:copper chaperone CopZ